MKERLTQYVNLLFTGHPELDDVRVEILQNSQDRYDDLILQGKSPEEAYQLASASIGDLSDILGPKALESGSNSQSIPLRPTPTYAGSAYGQSQEADDFQVPSADELHKRRMISIIMYVLCIIPVIALGDLGDGVLGVCLMFTIVAAATYGIITSSALPYGPQAAQIYAIRECRARGVFLFIFSLVPVIALGSIGTGALGVCLMLACIGLGLYRCMESKNAAMKSRRTLFTNPGSSRQKTYDPLDSAAELKQSAGRVIWAAGLLIWLALSIFTGAWQITWLLFPITVVVKKLVNACIDLKEVSDHE